MAIKVETGYLCSICNKQYPNSMQADACRDAHDIVYVPMTTTELNRLINAIFLEDFSLIPESLLEVLRNIQRHRVVKNNGV